MHQWSVFHRPEFGPVLACCTVDVPTPVLFADLSVSEEIMRRMKPGFFNQYGGDNALPHLDPRTLYGVAVANTVDGVLGRDR